MKLLFVSLFVIFALLYIETESTLGLDISTTDCGEITLDQWKCHVNEGKEFAIVEAFRGGYQIGEHLVECVANAWKAGMKHVDVYVFMCPNCRGNNPPETAVKTIVNYLSEHNVKYGMMWFDIELCTGCWNSASENAQWIKRAVDQAKSMGVNVGIYSSHYEWGATVGSYEGFKDLPQWYAHYDNNPSFSDSWAYQYGGWTKPSIKQYNDHSTNCYTNVDVDYY
ncbi:lysozyme protein [Anaeramoeba flamelloides]|uniref:Lysozyme protein n=1 Tax=Anaeramoeba flamelloides TaxID=1746091 RepID=A0AAV8A1A5_9EUKA|nr:lysozyme protein [Anaeramoeba flamelloides]KAJ6237511.1 lysozyme protein [Anaeramoeba flamelloides]